MLDEKNPESPDLKPPTSTPVIKFNLILLVVGGILAASLAKPSGGGSVVVFGVGFLAQAGINLLLALVNAIRGRYAFDYVFSGALVLLIGFGACTGMMLIR